MQLFCIKWPINEVKIFDRMKIYKQPWYHITHIKRMKTNDLSPFVKSVNIINKADLHTKGDNTLCFI